MKSTCVLPPLSDILHRSDHGFEHRQQQQHRYDHHYYPHHHQTNQRRRSSHAVLQVSNLLSNDNVNNSSSSDEDEFDDEPVKAKRKRASPSQLSVLNRVFQQTFFPSTELRMELGKQLGMSPRTVQIWFQNKRQSLRTRERVVVATTVVTPPVSPYSKPTHISLPPLRLPPPQQHTSWPLTPTSSQSQSPTASFDSSLLFRDF
ncbi:unnamed protein product [Mucor hiemalis]